jgi:hypothetical protein
VEKSGALTCSYPSTVQLVDNRVHCVHTLLTVHQLVFTVVRISLLSTTPVEHVQGQIEMHTRSHTQTLRRQYPGA